MADTRLLHVAVGVRDGGVNITNYVVDSSTDGIAWIAQAEEAATITHLGFRQGAVTGTSPVYKIGFQTRLVNGGTPDDTYLGGGSEQSATFTPVAGNDGTWVWVALDNSRAVTRGEEVCIVVSYSSGTIDASNNCSFTVNFAAQQANTGYPYPCTRGTGTWSRQDDYPTWGMKSSTTSYGNPISGRTTISADANDTPDENGMAFTVPSGVADTFNVIGIRVHADINNPSNTDVTSISLYNDTTLLQRKGFTGDLGSAAGEWFEMFFDEATLTDLSPGTEYIISFRTDSTNQVIDLMRYEFDTSAEADAAGQFAGGLSMGAVSRTNDGAWSAANYAHATQMFPIIKDITEPAGGGGGILIHPGMKGGLVG